MSDEFEEISPLGGQVVFNIVTKGDGRQSYQVSFRLVSDLPARIIRVIAVYAFHGEPVGPALLGGAGQLFSPPPFPGCVPVWIACDSEGQFGHQCPACAEYWRSGPYPSVCPYCAIAEQSHQFLSESQRRYIRHYCRVLSTALESVDDDEVVIDMDEVAEAVGKGGEKPEFYLSEQSQQNKFNCTACGEFNDILGRFGYCSSCGTRNDLALFEDQTVPIIRERLNSSGTPESCVRDGVASFESFIGQYARQLAEMVPMTESRRKRLSKQRFHNLREVKTIFENWFDIDIFADTKEDERIFVDRMFHRRHVYEHNGGEVDQKYLDDSGDTTVRLKQRLRETLQDVHRFLSLLVKMARNIHNAFHELLPPIPEPIKAFEDKKAQMEKHQSAS